MKKIGISLLVCLSLLSAGLVTADLYTAEKVKTLAKFSARQSMYNSDWHKYNLKDVTSRPGYIHLGDLLYANIHSQKPADHEGWWAAGSYTPEAYKTGWRTLVANNPKLAEIALERYGSSFVSAFEDELLAVLNSMKERKDGEERIAKIGAFDKDDFWKEQRIHFAQYTRLLDALLALDDETLNAHIAAIPDQLWSRGERTELQTWLLENGHIKVAPQDWTYGDDWRYGAWSMDNYPVDLLLLTHRISTDYPEWTPRKFLTQALEFSKMLEKVLP